MRRSARPRTRLLLPCPWLVLPSTPSLYISPETKRSGKEGDRPRAILLSQIPQPLFRFQAMLSPSSRFASRVPTRRCGELDHETIGLRLSEERLTI
jgi:hypothetical protein